MKFISTTKRVFEVLRVPPDKKSFEMVYGLIKANNIEMNITFEEFYIHTHACYAIQQNNQFIGFGYLTLSGNYPHRIYDLSIVTFDDDNNYVKLYETIQTVVAAHRDGDIIVKNVNKDYSILISALKNNKFKQKKNKDGSIEFILSAGTRIYDSIELRDIDYTDKIDTIDKIIKIDGEEVADVESAQEKYIQDLINNQDPIDYSKIDPCNEQEGEQKLSEFLPDDIGIPACCPKINCCQK